MPSWNSAHKLLDWIFCTGCTVAVVAAAVLIAGPRSVLAQSNQIKQYFLVDGSGKKMMALTVFPDDTETAELLNSKGQAYARLTDRGGTRELDMLAPKGHVGIFVTSNRTFGLTAALSANRKLAIPVPQSQESAAARLREKSEYNYQKCLQRANVLKDATVTVTGAGGKGVGLWDHEVATDSIRLELFDPQGDEFGYVDADIHQGEAHPSFGDYELWLLGDTAHSNFVAEYHLSADWRKEPPTLSANLSLPHGATGNGFYELDPRTLKLARWVPNGLSFLWLNMPDAFPGLPLRVQTTGGKTGLTTAVKNGPNALFVLAVKSYIGSHYGTAIQQFREYLGNHPAAKQAAAAQYLIGECYFSEASWAKAVAELNIYIARYPNGFKVPEAMLSVAHSELGLGQRQAAIAEFRSLIQKYPQSVAARVAKPDLNRLLAIAPGK